MTTTTAAARISRVFLITAVLLGLSGMLLGMFMGIAEDFRLKSVHVHVNLIGFVTMFLAGLFYRVVPGVSGAMAWTHYGAAALGLSMMAPGLVGIFLGIPSIAWMIKPGSSLVLVGMLIFVWNVIWTTRPGAGAAGGASGSASPSFKVVDDAILGGRAEAARIITQAARAAAPHAA